MMQIDRGPFRGIAESPPSVDERFDTVHYLSVIFLSSSRPVLKILVNIEWTFNHIQEEIQEDTPEHWILLQAHYGPNPYWTPLEPAEPRLIGATCQTLYAFNRNIGSEHVLAVVRKADSDYPLVVHAGTTTVREAVETAEPHLKTLITNITWAESQEDIGDLPFSSILAKRKSHPNGLIINTGESMSEEQALITLHLNANVDSIQPFLQDLFLGCKDLVRRGLRLELFALQTSHVAQALLHVTVCLSSSLHKSKPRKSGGADQDLAAQEADRIAFLLAGILQQTMDDVNKIVNRIISKDLRFIRRDVEEICWKLCGEYPGAMTIRHVYGHLENLRNLDLVSDVHIAFGKSAEDSELRDFFRDSIPALIKLLENKNCHVRRFAVVAIGNLVEDSEIHDTILGTKPLLLKLRDDEDPNVRSAAATALRNFSKHSGLLHVFRDAYLFFIERRKDEDPNVGSSRKLYL